MSSYRYSDSFDGDFIISPHPKYQNLIVATGDSGHGMKYVFAKNSNRDWLTLWSLTLLSVRFIPVIGYKIAQVVEGVDNEYTRAWAWRAYGKGRFDSMRLLNNPDRPHLGQGIARFARPEELKAIKSKL